MSVLRLLVTVPWGSADGGAETMLDTFLSSLSAREVEPHIVFLADGPWRPELAHRGIRTSLVRSGRLRDGRQFAATVRRLRHMLEEQRPDILLNWSSKTHLYGGIAALHSSVPVVWWQHGMPSSTWLDRMATMIPADAIGCSSVASAEAQRRLRPRRPVLTVHPGVQEPAAATIRNETRAGLGFGDEPVIGIVGRLQPWKGQDRLIRALQILHQRGCEAKLLVVGGSAFGLSLGYADELIALAREAGLDKHVLFLGQRDEPGPLIEAMDVLVNASEGEPFGIVLIEAMARRTPVVAVDAGGPREIITHEETGMLARSGSAPDLANAVEPLLKDATLRSQLTAAAHETVLERFSASGMATEMVRKLAVVAGNGYR